MKKQPTPLSGYEVRTIRKYSVIVILIIIALALLFNSCSPSQSLTEHHKHDYLILEVDNPYLEVRYWNKKGEPFEKIIFYPSDTLKPNTVMICECKRR